MFLKGCRKNGWQNLLYVNTLLDNEEPNNCMGVTWYHKRFSILLDLIKDEDLFMDHMHCRYLVCDMVFHFVSLPLIFYPMHFLWKVKVSFYKNHP